jgi:putative DNA primase/helicase
MNAEELAHSLRRPHRCGDGWTACCPSHDDRHQSLTIHDKPGDINPLVCCQKGCSQEQVIAALTQLGLWEKRNPGNGGGTIVYPYVDEAGATLFEVCKKEQPKRFWQRQPDGQGGYKRGKNGRLTMQGARYVPYHLDRLVAARQNANGHPPRVYVCEGEKDADNLATGGLLTTTNPGGASLSRGKSKWREDYNQFFAGFDVVILPDNDEAGRTHPQHVAANLAPVAHAVRIVELPGLAKKGEDVTDWIHAGGTPDALNALVEQTPLWVPPPPNLCPQITVEPGERHLAADAGLAALKTAGTPFYQRGGKLVRVAKLKARAADKSEIQVPGIAAVTMPMPERALGSAAAWETRKYGKYQPDDPPSAVAEQIMSMTDEWHFPPLVGVIACPTLRPDGSLLNAEGYDAKTGLVLYSTVIVPQIKETPTKAEALAALKLLCGLLDEFPFADDISKSVALSMLMTPVLRGAMEAAPMHLFTAPQSGTGKSYIANLSSLIGTGERAAAFAVSVKPEETEKRLNGHALAGFPVILMDNCGALIDGDPTLCQIIEQPRLSIRRLGISEPVAIDNTFTIFANGNNTSVVDDLVRRTLRGKLDANMEEPETRAFKGNPARLIANDRGKYVAAILTIARAHITSKENPLPPLPSFDGWSNFVRSPLVWLGCADPVKSIEQLRKADPVRSERAIVFEAWRDDIGIACGFTAPRLIELANETTPGALNFSYARPEFRNALLQIAVKFGTNNVIEPRRLGKWLTQHENTVAVRLKLSVDRHDERRPLYSLQPQS